MEGKRHGEGHAGRNGRVGKAEGAVGSGPPSHTLGHTQLSSVTGHLEVAAMLGDLFNLG